MNHHGVFLSGLILIFSLPLSESAATFGTAVAAIRIPAQAVIAADSRVVDANGMRMPDVCKIRVVDETVYTAHGMSTHAPTGFDLFQVVAAAIRARRSFASAAALVGESVGTHLSAALLHVRRTESKVFERVVNGPATGVILARNENGAPHLASIRFVVQQRSATDLQIVPDVRLCPGPDCAQGIAAVWVSPSEDRLEFQRANSNYWERDLVQVATAFVQGEIDKGFPDTGPPIDVIRISGEQIMWVRRQKACE